MAPTNLLQQDNIMLFLAQHVSNHGIALRTVFAKVADSPDKRNREYGQSVCLHTCITTKKNKQTPNALRITQPLTSSSERRPGH